MHYPVNIYLKNKNGDKKMFGIFSEAHYQEIEKTGWYLKFPDTTEKTEVEDEKDYLSDVPKVKIKGFRKKSRE